MNPELTEFLKQVEELTVPVHTPNIEFRLYYNENGTVVACTQTLPVTDQTGPYVTVTKDQYNRYFDYCVESGALKKIDRDAGYRVQLMKSTKGNAVVYGHAGVIIEPNEVYPNIEYYERKTNN